MDCYRCLIQWGNGSSSSFSKKDYATPKDIGTVPYLRQFQCQPYIRALYVLPQQVARVYLLVLLQRIQVTH